MRPTDRPSGVAARGRARWWAAGEVGLILTAFAILRCVAVIHSPKTFRDTVTYLPLNFVGGADRLWTVPLIWKIFGTPHLRESAQLVAGVGAWSGLALSIRMLVRDRWVALVAMTVALMLGLVPQVTGWDNILLSESLSSSLLVADIALLIVMSSRPTRAVTVSLVIVTALWMFTRPDNVVIYLAVLPFTVGFAGRRMGWRRGAPIVLALVVLAVWGTYDITRDGDAPVVNYNAVQILVNRIAPNRGSLTFFRERGLPISPALIAEQGSFPGHVSPLFASTRFMAWVTNHFQSTYAAYLLRRLPTTIGRGLYEIPGAVSSLTDADLTARPVLPDAVTSSLWGTGSGELGAWLVVAIVLGALARSRTAQWPRGMAVVGLLALVVLLGGVLTWNLTGYPGAGNPELARLFMPMGIALRVALLLAIALSVDALRIGGAAALGPAVNG